MTNRSRARWSLAVAVAAHALAIAWTQTRTRTPSVLEGRGAPLTELEIAVEPPPVVAPAAPDSPPDSPARTVEGAAPLVGPRTARAAHAGPTSAEAPAAPVVSADPGGVASWTFSPQSASAQAEQRETARQKAQSDAVAAGVGAVLAEAAKKAADRARKPFVFTPRDMELGLVPGSQYRAIARDRVRNSQTPMNGHALLEFWTDSRGIVARVRVLDASSDRRAWDDVADALAGDARAAFPLKIPSNADGLIVTLDVTSALKTLSGAMLNENPLARALRSVQNPVDAVLDSKTAPQRIVVAKVVGVEAF